MVSEVVAAVTGACANVRTRKMVSTARLVGVESERREPATRTRKVVSTARVNSTARLARIETLPLE